jgi:hypothetical protein
MTGNYPSLHRGDTLRPLSAADRELVRRPDHIAVHNTLGHRFGRGGRSRRRSRRSTRQARCCSVKPAEWLRAEIAEIKQLAELVPGSIGDNKAARHSETLQPGCQVWRFPDLPAPEPNLIRSGRQRRPSGSDADTGLERSTRLKGGRRLEAEDT